MRLATAAGDKAALADLQISAPTPYREPREKARLDAIFRAGLACRPPNPTDTIQQVMSAPHWTPADMALAAK